MYRHRAKIVSLAMVLMALVTACGGVKLKNLPPRNKVICCFGDSLVEGVGAGGPKNSYPAQLAQRLKCDVYNWGKSGDTTADGVGKLGAFVDNEFGIIVVTLGGNDILKRTQWPETEKNLYTIFSKLTATGAVVVFTGVTGPLNPSRNKLYRKMCAKEGVLFIPEIIKGIRTNPDLKSDEIHPNAKGYGVMAERVAVALREAGLVE